MRTLSPAERRALRANAHHLHPVVTIGQHGLTPAVLHEIEVALLAHELVKIRVFSDDRTEREALLARICAELDAASVQHLGKLLIVWRPAPESVGAESVPAAVRKPGRTKGARRGATSRAEPRKPSGKLKSASRRKLVDARKPFDARKSASAHKPADAIKPAGTREPSGVRRPGAPAATANARGYAAGVRRRRAPR